MTWDDVKAKIVVKQVASLVAGDPWEMNEASLMLTECDSGAPRSFFRTFQIDGRSNKQFDPPLMESDWCDLVSRILGAVPAGEVEGMGDTVRKADAGVIRHGIWATVLSKIGSAKEEGSDVPGVLMPGQRVDRKRSLGCGLGGRQRGRGREF